MKRIFSLVFLLVLVACGAQKGGLATAGKDLEDSDGHGYTPLDAIDNEGSNATNGTNGQSSSTTQATSSSSGSNNSSSGATTSINVESYSTGRRVNVSILIGKWHGQCGLEAAETVLGVELQRTSARAMVDKSRPALASAGDYFHIANRANCSSSSGSSYCQVNASMRHFSGVTALTMLQIDSGGMILIKAGTKRANQWSYLRDQFGILVSVAQILHNEMLVHDLGNGYAVEIRKTETRKPHVICGN